MMKAKAATTERGQVAIGLARLEVADHKAVRPDAATIVMLHEGLGSVSTWRHVPERIGKQTGCRVVAYSRQGHGKSNRLESPRTASFMHHEGETVLPVLLKSLDVQLPILLGHSDGGSIALLYAAAYPDATKALILEAPHVFVEDLTVSSIQARSDSYEQSEMREKLARHHDHADEMFRAWADIWLDPEFRKWNIEDRLANVRCPVLLIQGEDDEYGTRAQVDSIAKRIQRTEILMLPKCGHAPHRDQQDAVLEAIEKFVATLE
jgi:pimeloyl-ACP methyl ester carboxylesterase